MNHGFASELGLGKREVGWLKLWLYTILLNFFLAVVPVPFMSPVVGQVWEHDFSAWLQPMDSDRPFIVKGE